MKNLSIFLLFFLASAIAFGQGVPSPSEPRLQVDGAGNRVSDDYPLPVKLQSVGTVTVKLDEIVDAVDILNASMTQSLTQIENAASATTAELTAKSEEILTSIATVTANYATIQTSSITVTDTSANISALASRDFITLQNVGTGTIYLNIGGTPATSAGYRLYSQGSISIQKIAAAVPISVISATSESNELKIVQGAK